MPTTTIDVLADELELTRLDLIKLDVEGAEGAALRGATKALERFRPMVMLELQAPSLAAAASSVDAVLASLTAARYQLFAFERLSGRLRRLPSAEFSTNVVAVPDEKVSLVSSW